MASPNEDIERALHQRLKDNFATFGLTEATQVSWPNKKFVPTNGKLWIRPSVMLGQPSPGGLGVDAPNQDPGVYHVSIFAPDDGGNGAANALAGKIVTAFKRGTTLTFNSDPDSNLRVIFAYPAPAIDNDDSEWYHVPVVIGFEAFSANT